MRLWKALAVLVVLLTGTANAATWYVSTSGNDANAGTLSAPFRTINKAAGVAVAGDQVQVRGGIYNGLVSIASKGTASAHIAFRSYPGETAVLDGTGTAADSNLVTLYKAAYVDFTDFEVRNATRIGILVWGSNNIRIANNNVHHSWRNGIYSGYDTAGVTTDITVDNNDVHDNVLENQNHALSGGGWSTGISLTKTERGSVTRNKVHANQGEGIGMLLTNRVTIQNNTVWNNFSVNIYLDNAKYITVDRNFVYSDGASAYYRDGYAASGIGTANESYSTSNPLSDLTITNNIVVNSKYGFYYGNYEAGGGLHNTVIANNTFYKGSAALLWIDASAHTSTYVENNIFDQVGNAMTQISGSGVTYRNNNWYGGSAGAASGGGDVLADPRLANPGGLTAADYKLTTLSPVVAVGVSISSVTTDYFGVARGVTFDIGAHQIGTSSGAGPAPTLDTTAPSAPGSLTATPASTSAITLSWSAATDNIGVTGYRVFRNGALVNTTTATSYTDQGLNASTSYSYNVYAIDAAGNQSSASNTASATTAANAPAADTQAPSAPGSLRVDAVSGSSIALGWNAASDNVGVTAYRVYRNGAAVATINALSWTDSSLAAGTTYSYTVTALDAAGNQSASSNMVSATPTASTKRHAARH